MKIVKILGLIIVVLIGLIFLTSIIGGITFKSSVKKEVIEMFKNSRVQGTEVITEADLEGLPAPVQKYLRYCGIVGKEPISSVTLRMIGQFKPRQAGDFMPMEADEYYTVFPPAFIWLGTVRANPLIHIRARDRYLAGKGNMLIKILSTLTVANAVGNDMDEASLMRYLNEMMWFPTAYLNDNISWQEIDDRSAKVSLTDSGITVSATVYFNETGEMINFVAPRFNSTTGKKEIWSTPITAYKEVYGLRIPSKGEAVWKLADGDFCYIKLEVTDIEYNAGPPAE